MSKKLIHIIVLLFFQLIFSQTIRPEIQNLVDKIQNGNTLTSEFIYYEGQKSKQFELFQLIDSLATKEELIKLVEHNSPPVRCAAFSPLCRLDLEYSKKVLIAHLNDYQEINLQVGCIGYKSYVADEFINIIRYHLSKDDRDYLISLNKQILNDPNCKLQYKSARIRSLEINSENYDLIRRLTLEKTYPEAIIALSKYKNPKDIGIIIGYFGNDKTETYAIHAAKSFPDICFYPYLIKVFKQEWRDRYYSYPKWRILYQALAQYPDEEQTLKLFDKTMSVHNKFRKRTLGKYLWIAATKYPNPKFEIYKNKINLNGNDFLLKEEMDVE